MKSNKSNQALSPTKRALLALEKLNAKLDVHVRAKHEPIAIIGMGCRFPGADSPQAYWQLLREGRDAICEVPADRFAIDEYYDPDPDAPDKMWTRRAGWVDHLAEFDAHFFSISPKEARIIDPQHRLLLEVCWEALEDAALAPEQITKRTGVFIGIDTGDYLRGAC